MNERKSIDFIRDFKWYEKVLHWLDSLINQWLDEISEREWEKHRKEKGGSTETPAEPPK